MEKDLWRMKKNKYWSEDFLKQSTGDFLKEFSSWKCFWNIFWNVFHIYFTYRLLQWGYFSDANFNHNDNIFEVTVARDRGMSYRIRSSYLGFHARWCHLVFFTLWWSKEDSFCTWAIARTLGIGEDICRPYMSNSFTGLASAIWQSTKVLIPWSMVRS